MGESSCSHNFVAIATIAIALKAHVSRMSDLRDTGFQELGDPFSSERLWSMKGAWWSPPKQELIYMCGPEISMHAYLLEWAVGVNSQPFYCIEVYISHYECCSSSIDPKSCVRLCRWFGSLGKPSAKAHMIICGSSGMYWFHNCFLPMRTSWSARRCCSCVMIFSPGDVTIFGSAEMWGELPGWSCQ